MKAKKEGSNSISDPNDKLMEYEEQGVCHTVALPFTLRTIKKKCKRRNMKTQIFHHAKKII
jgi:hypothetical protein